MLPGLRNKLLSKIPEKQQFEEIILFSVFTAGVLLSLIQYFFNRSLWLDEAMLAINIVTINAVDLIKPLKFDQVAPVLFLQFERFFSWVIPNSELGLRLFPLICYLFALFSFFRIISALFDFIYLRIVTLAFFVFNSNLIYYSNEVKQYMTDVMVLSVVNYLILKTYKIPRSKYLLLSIAGVISVFLSNVAVIILFSAGLYWFIQDFRKTKFKVFVVVFGSWVVAFGIYYFFFILDHPARTVMLDYWKGANAFMPLNPTNPAFLLFFFEKTQVLLGVLSNSKSVIVGSFFGLLVFAGFINLIIKRKEKAFIILFLLPIIVHLSLSAFQFYPFDKRLILYMVPNFIIAIGYGFGLMAHFLNNYLTTTRLRIIAVVFSCFVASLLFLKGFPMEKEELKKSMNFIRKNISSEDKIYVYYGATNAIEYYRIINYLDFENELVSGTSNKTNKPEYLKEVMQISGPKWLLVSHDVDNEEEYIVTQLTSNGYDRLKEFHAKGSSAYLFDLKK